MRKQTEEEKLRQILYNLDWFKIMQKAIESRKTSWSERPIVEWRNATDEVCMAVINALEDKGVLENMFIKSNRFMGKEFVLEELEFRDSVDFWIKDCQEQKHIQQVAYSTYHSCLTQVCFTCKKVRTNIKQKGGLNSSKE